MASIEVGNRSSLDGTTLCVDNLINSFRCLGCLSPLNENIMVTVIIQGCFMSIMCCNLINSFRCLGCLSPLNENIIVTGIIQGCFVSVMFRQFLTRFSTSDWFLAMLKISTEHGSRAPVGSCFGNRKQHCKKSSGKLFL